MVETPHKGPHGNVVLWPCAHDGRLSALLGTADQTEMISSGTGGPALRDAQGPRLGTARSVRPLRREAVPTRGRVRQPRPTPSTAEMGFPSYYGGFSLAPTGLRHPRPRGTQALALFSRRLTTDPWVLGFRFLSHVLRRTKRGLSRRRFRGGRQGTPTAESRRLPR